MSRRGLSILVNQRHNQWRQVDVHEARLGVERDSVLQISHAHLVRLRSPPSPKIHEKNMGVSSLSLHVVLYVALYLLLFRKLGNGEAFLVTLKYRIVA